MITQERLKEALRYDQFTGDFTWIRRRSGASVGSVAGHLDIFGYIVIGLDRKVYKAHRLAFLYMDGKFPVNDVDHDDHVRHNNIWSNLNEATNQENHKNCSMNKNNSSGFTGVFWRKDNERWRVQIMADGKKKYLGCFTDINEAIAVRKAANIEYGYHANHGSQSLKPSTHKDKD